MGGGWVAVREALDPDCPPSAPDPACIQAFLRKGLPWQTALHSCLLLSALRLLGEVRVPQPSIPVGARQPQVSEG